MEPVPGVDNGQQHPLLEKLDWVFTSSSWTLSYPKSSAMP
jgi:hypothetical protein